MKAFIWTIRLWLAARYEALFLKPSLDVYKIKWTQEDEDNFRAYLVSSNGEKLQMVLLAHVQNTDHQAVAISTPRACGYAAGQRAMLANFIALSGHVPPQVDESVAEEPQRIPRYRNTFSEPSNEKLEHS